LITGNVLSRRALLPVTFRVADQPNLAIEFQVDTGFTGGLTLPINAVEALGLPFLRTLRSILADGSHVDIATHRASILWNGAEQSVIVLATGRHPLLGMALLDGFELRVRYAEGDRVTIEEL
jgi:clan AA aspartic protease